MPRRRCFYFLSVDLKKVFSPIQTRAQRAQRRRREKNAEILQNMLNEQLEALNLMQDLLASLDVGVYAVGYDFHPEGWRDVIRQHAWDFAMHVSDVPSMQNQAVRDSLLLNGLTNQESLGFREYLDIRTTPKMYLLDSNNKILSKGMGAEAVPDLVRARAKESGR